MTTCKSSKIFKNPVTDNGFLFQMFTATSLSCTIIIYPRLQKRTMIRMTGRSSLLQLKSIPSMTNKFLEINQFVILEILCQLRSFTVETRGSWYLQLNASAQEKFEVWRVPIFCSTFFQKLEEHLRCDHSAEPCEQIYSNTICSESSVK